MATKAERFRSEMERSGPKRAPRQVRVPRGLVPDVAAHRESAHADRKATYVLEDSAAGPSRRSSRKASNRQRTDGKMIQKRRVALARPSAPRAPARGR